MADSLVLTGVKDVKKHTGTEMLLTRPKRGGDTHSVKEWWKGGGVSTCYVECSVFDVTTAAGTVKLVLDSGASTNVRIDHDGAFNFDFYGINEVRRGALFTSAFELIEHYVFPAISGGKVMTVTPAGGASRPNAPADTTIGTVTVSGDTTPADSTIESYTVAISGDASNLSYAWSVSGAGTASGGTTGSTFSVAYSGTTDPSTVTCVVTSSDLTVTDSPKTGTLAIDIPTA